MTSVRTGKKENKLAICNTDIKLKKSINAPSTGPRISALRDITNRTPGPGQKTTTKTTKTSFTESKISVSSIKTQRKIKDSHITPPPLIKEKEGIVKTTSKTSNVISTSETQVHQKKSKPKQEEEGEIEYMPSRVNLGNTTI